VNNMTARELQSSRSLSWEDLVLLELLVRFQTGFSRSPEVRSRLEQLGEHVHQVVLREMHAEIDHLMAS